MPETITILNVDDVASNRYVKTKLMRRQGYVVVEAEDGASALELARALRPNLVLLDVMLPDINGMEVCRRIKSDPATQGVLVLQISASAVELSDRVRSLDAGADAYLAEPVEPIELTAVVAALLRLQVAEADVRLSVLQWRATFDAIEEGLALIDGDGAIVQGNRALGGILGRDLEALQGQPLADMVPGVNLASMLAGTLAPSVEAKLDGDRWYRMTLSPTSGRNGAPAAVCVFTEITGHKESERVLREARAEAERANAAKSHFLAAASHDLRQPLQGLRLLMDLIQRRMDDSEQKRLIGTAIESLADTEALLNALLDLSTFESGGVRPQFEQVALHDIFARLVAECRPVAERKGLSLRFVTSAATVRSDPVLLLRVLRNLASNAIRYTERGGILLGCRRHGARLRLCVYDTGPGIPPEMQQQVFGEFVQLRNQHRDRREGLGLGLAIASHMATVLHHQVGMLSVPGRGSVFWVDVAMGEGDGDSEIEASQDASIGQEGGIPPGMTVLIVEDDALQRSALTMLLQDWGLQVIEAHDLESALAAVAAAPAKPDALLTDFRLPQYSTGLEVAKQVNEALGRLCPAILLTGDLGVAVPDAAGDVYQLLYKPYRPGDLRQALRKALAAAATTVPAQG